MLWRVTGESLEFSLPVWTPGYYQLMTYAKQIEGFSATDGDRALTGLGSGRRQHVACDDRWGSRHRTEIRGARAKDFIAENAVSRDQGYVVPTATFLHPVGQLKQPVKLKVEPRCVE